MSNLFTLFFNSTLYDELFCSPACQCQYLLNIKLVGIDYIMVSFGRIITVNLDNQTYHVDTHKKLHPEIKAEPILGKV